MCNPTYNCHMSIHLHAIYKAGVILPDQPLELPEGAALEVTVTLTEPTHELAQVEVPEIMRPSVPSISPEEVQARIDQYAVAVGSLPVDFSRANIYQDHD